MNETLTFPSKTTTSVSILPTSSLLYYQLAPNFISTEEKQDYFQSHVHQLRNAITKSRRALQKSLTLARLVSKKYARLKKVVPYRSNGNAFWIEMHLDPRLNQTFKNCPDHNVECSYCCDKQKDLILDAEKIKLHPTKIEQNRYLHRVHGRRIIKLSIARKKYQNRLENVHHAVQHSKQRIKSTNLDLERLSLQMDQVEKGTYNTETNFMTKRQQNDIKRESMLFKTSSVHAFGQELEIDQAKPTLNLEIERATIILTEKAMELNYLTHQHPLILHSFAKIASWFKFRLRIQAGRRARKAFRQRIIKIKKSEDLILYHLFRRLAASIIQRGWRCCCARSCLFRLRNMKAIQMIRRLQKWWRLLLIKKRNRLLLKMFHFIMKCACQKMKTGWKLWWKVIEKMRRIEWLRRHVRKCKYHMSVITLQKKFRYYLSIGRKNFIQKVKSKLHFSIHKKFTVQLSTCSLSLDRWTFQACLFDLENLQKRTKRLLNHAEIYFKFSNENNNKNNNRKTNTKRKTDSIYRTFAKGTLTIPAYYLERYRGIGTRHDVKWSKYGESYEWLLLQSVDRRFRACQAVLDFVTNMFDQHGHSLDLSEMRKACRDLLRSLDPRFVHDAVRTKERTSSFYFAWFFDSDVSLCAVCFRMIERRSNGVNDGTTVVCKCGRHKFQFNQMGQTYSEILGLPQEKIKRLKRKNKLKNQKTSFMEGTPGEIINAVPPLPTTTTRESRPKALSDIHIDSFLFLIHCHFWASAPKRFGDGRDPVMRANVWNKSVEEAKIWSQLLLNNFGVDTISKLALWSVTRLINIGNVPRRTAEKIGLMLGMLQREMDKWRVTQGESLMLNKMKIVGASVVEIPDEFC